MLVLWKYHIWSLTLNDKLDKLASYMLFPMQTLRTITSHGFSAMINNHFNHPSIVKRRENISNDLVFNFQCVNVHDISKITKSCDGKEVHGYDMVPSKVLQKLAPYIAPDISRLINNSVLESVFPSDLKFAEMSSLFKKKHNLNKINYRPTSILIALSKYTKKPRVFN